MKRILNLAICCLLLNGLLSNCAVLHAEEMQIKRVTSSKQNSGYYAVIVKNAVLLHTTQLLPVDAQGKIQGDSIEQQTTAVLNSLQLICAATETTQKQIVKLNLYLESEIDRIAVMKILATGFAADSMPAISFVQTRLPNLKAKIALDAVIAAQALQKAEVQTEHLSLNLIGSEKNQAHVSILPPGDVVYVSGQAVKGTLKEATAKTLESLLDTLKQMKLDRQNIIALKCFVSTMDQIEIVKTEITKFFAEDTIPAVSFVEWTAGKAHPIEIELIASAPQTESAESVSYFTPKQFKSSPVYSKVARIHGNSRIYLAAITAEKKGTGEEQIIAIYKTFDELLKKSSSNFLNLAKATYYVSDADASSQLNALRPKYYNPKRPPAASKAMVKGVGMQDRTISIDLIAAPAK